MTVVGLDNSILDKVSRPDRRRQRLSEPRTCRGCSSTGVSSRRLPTRGIHCSRRLRFLSISASNLDEFFTVRAAGLRQLVTKGCRDAQPGRNVPRASNCIAIHEEADRLTLAQQARWEVLKPRDRERKGIQIVEPDAS